jgi:hypothetical protein
MPTVPGEALQRVCPHCSTLAYTAADRCPWCGGSYRRRLWPLILGVAVVQAAVILAGLALLLASFGDDVDARISREVDRVQRQIDTQFDAVRRDVRSQLDARLPSTGTAPLPTPTPAP